MSRYQVFDLETENHEVHRRFANPFSDKNWAVARGWKLQGDAKCSWTYHPKPDKTRLHIPKDVTLLVGHNIKFDLLYEWTNPDLIAFLKRGGRIWDTQYVEYLLEGQHPDYHMNKLEDLAVKYGGTKKLDAVKALWEMGVLTSQIDKDMLIDYLVGTEDEQRNAGDIGNTERVFLAQLKRVKKMGMGNMILARMDGLLCTTEMEFNGIKVDVQEAKRRMKILNQELSDAEKALEEYIPEMPKGLTFNWASNIHVSCLIFGGTIKYKRQAPYKNEEGEWVRKMNNEVWPLFKNTPVPPDKVELRDDGLYYLTNAKFPTGLQQDTFVSGKKKGSGKTKNMKVPGERKVKYQDFTHYLPGYTAPDAKWQGALTDGAGEPIYSTAAEVIEELGARDIPFLKTMAKRQSISKDLGTYYLRYDERKKDYVGMLTCVMPESHIIHHNLNHTSTVTSRLSSANPNLQNIPRGDTSEVKKMFISRFAHGRMLEADYSQLEVVVQGLLTQDENLCRDLRDRIDFHCKRVAAKFNIPYEEALYRCKDDSYEDHATWKKHRTGCKEFSFQRAYGAGAPAIAASTGLPLEDVLRLIEVEEEMYPGVSEFNNMVEHEVKRNAVPFKDAFRGMRTFRRGYWQAPTGTLYSFRSYDPLDWQREKGITDSFMPTEIKNYPTQGTAGEIVQVVLGKLFRHFRENDNYGGRALLNNTVHDCIWVDFDYDGDDEFQTQVATDIKRIMESVPEYLNELYGMDVPVPFPVEVEVGDNLYDKHVLHI